MPGLLCDWIALREYLFNSYLLSRDFPDGYPTRTYTPLSNPTPCSGKPYRSVRKNIQTIQFELSYSK